LDSAFARKIILKPGLSSLLLRNRAIMSGERQQTDWRSLYPYDSQWFTTNGQQLHYVDVGQSSPGKPTLVLLHGNPTWSFYYRELIQAWSKDYRVIALDHLGCGLSSKPQVGPYLLSDRIDHATALIRQLRLQNVTILGHDWGGAIATGVAQELPGIVTRIVLLNTGAFRCPTIPWRIAVCRWPVLGPLGVRGMNLFLRAAFLMGLERRDRITPLVRAGYLAPYGSWSERVAIQNFVNDIPMDASHPSYATLEKIELRLSSMTIPKLLIWGMKDWCFTPWFLEQFQKFWPDAQVLKLPAAGHWVVEDAPHEVRDRVLEFLSTKPAT
jgi:cis-3-alkyl-4-acyloxetan-2-one decarboxylase